MRISDWSSDVCSSDRRPEPFLLANHIFGPSYVSVETALSYYGLIPERVYETTSMTTQAPRKFNTPLGTFTYTRLPLPYYAFGTRSVKLANDQYARTEQRRFGKKGVKKYKSRGW